MIVVGDRANDTAAATTQAAAYAASHWRDDKRSPGAERRASRCRARHRRSAAYAGRRMVSGATAQVRVSASGVRSASASAPKRGVKSNRSALAVTMNEPKRSRKSTPRTTGKTMTRPRPRKPWPPGRVWAASAVSIAHGRSESATRAAPQKAPGQESRMRPRTTRSSVTRPGPWSRGVELGGEPDRGDVRKRDPERGLVPAPPRGDQVERAEHEHRVGVPQVSGEVKPRRAQPVEDARAAAGRGGPSARPTVRSSSRYAAR